MATTTYKDDRGTWKEFPKVKGVVVRHLEEAEPEFLAKCQPADLTPAEARRAEFPGTDVMVVALWEHVVEGRTEAATALQAVREAIKTKYPLDNDEPPTRWTQIKKFFGLK